MTVQKYIMPHGYLICDKCGFSRAISGVARIERGSVAAFLCLDCADKGELDRLNQIRERKEMQRRAHRT